MQHAFRFQVAHLRGADRAGHGEVFLLFGDELIMLYLRGEGTEAERQALAGLCAELSAHHPAELPCPSCLTQILPGTLRECGQTVVPMVAGIVSVAVNLCFNTLLIFGYRGFPKLGSTARRSRPFYALCRNGGRGCSDAPQPGEEPLHRRRKYRTLRLPKQLAWQITKKTTPLMINETLLGARRAPPGASAIFLSGWTSLRRTTSARP